MIDAKGRCCGRRIRGTMVVTKQKPQSWRVCPKCRGRATKIFSLCTGKLLCQQCGHEYEPPVRKP